MVGNFNTNLATPEEWARDEEIAADITESGLEDMIGHFLLRCGLRTAGYGPCTEADERCAPGPNTSWL